MAGYKSYFVIVASIDGTLAITHRKSNHLVSLWIRSGVQLAFQLVVAVRQEHVTSWCCRASALGAAREREI
jgi:hypothetical protein